MRSVACVALTLLVCVLAGCGGSEKAPPIAQQSPDTPSSNEQSLPGMPPVDNPQDIYSHDHVGMLSPVVKGMPERVYVPNAESNTVDVIDPKTAKVTERFLVGKQPQHVVPSYDLKTLWVTNDKGNSLTPIDPFTAKPGRPVPVDDPYNLYFTPDGRSAIVVAEQRGRLDFRDSHTMALQKEVPVPCRGIDHADFSANGRYALFSCEFSGEMVKVDIAAQKVDGVLHLRPGDLPQDVKLSPDGKTFYVADQHEGGVYLVDGDQLRVLGFIPTGPDAHGLYVSRDSKDLYVSNRQGGGSVSVIPFATNRVEATWRVPGGGSPDMGGVSADGRLLWLTGRYHREIYAFDTETGRLVARVKVGNQPHGAAVFPQPGRYSTGHTGVFR